METIYGLIDPRDGLVAYIGYTKKPINDRLKAHIQDSKRFNRTHKQKWIRKLLSLNLEPSIIILKQFKTRTWEYWEKRYIKKYRKRGYLLKNSTDGGDGVTMTPEVRKKISEKSKLHRHSDEAKAKMSLAKLGKIGKDSPNSKGLIAYNDKEELFFYSAYEAELYFKNLGLKASKKNISACLRGSKSHGGKYLRHQVAGYKFKKIINE
jgi:hypothetical protein